MINKIKKYDLCIGCGLCESVLSKDKCQMVLNERGFYEPVINEKLAKNEKLLVKKICPGIHVETTKHKGAWGSMIAISEAWSTNPLIRHKAASGGVITSLAIYLLETHKVDAILQVGVKENNYLLNELKVSRTREDVELNARSRYAPALVFNDIRKILDTNKGRFAFIGKPCDIAGIKNFINEYSQYYGRIEYFLSIFCAGIPSYNATIQVWRQSGHLDEPISLKYRGDGWPGNFHAIFKNGDEYKISYRDSWGKILGKKLGFRCKICPDGIGMLADISVGDSWNTVDGYPDFSESEGKCFCMIRTQKGMDIMQDAIKAGYIESREMDIQIIKEQQAYQYNRRKIEGWRITPVQIITGGILNFKGLGIYRMAVRASIGYGVRNMVGTFKRLLEIQLRK